MGSWYSCAKFSSNCDAGEILGRGLLNAAISSLGTEEYIDWLTDDCEDEEGGRVKFDDLDGFYNELSYYYEGYCCGASPDEISDFFLAATCAISALYPECACVGMYQGEYSVGGFTWVRCQAQRGMIERDELDDEGERFEKIRNEFIKKRIDPECNSKKCKWNHDWDEEFIEDWFYPSDYLNNESYVERTPCSEIALNWTGESTCHVIRAAMDSDKLERVEGAIRNKYITCRMLEEALEAATEEADAEVTAFLLEQIHHLPEEAGADTSN